MQPHSKIILCVQENMAQYFLMTLHQSKPFEKMTHREVAQGYAIFGVNMASNCTVSNNLHKHTQRDANL
jgi:hypothetical protein